MAERSDRPAVTGGAERASLGRSGAAAFPGGGGTPGDGGTGPEDLLRQLWRSRANAFRAEVAPYFRYVAQSGFGLLVTALLLAAAIQYTLWLNEFPPDVPLGLYGAAWLWLAAVWAPMRTYLQEADTVFLLPMERAALNVYIRPLLVRAAAGGAIRALGAFALLAPLYVRAPHTLATAAGRPLWLLAAAFAAIGAWNAWGAWRERQTIEALPRMLLRLARYGATIAAAWGLLNAPLAPALAFAALAAWLVTALGRLPRRQVLPWERLIREEARARLRWQRFLSWFVDIPLEGWRPARRRWAAWAGDRLPWDRRHMWHYLYAKTFVRGETFGAWLRWHAVIGLLMLVFRASLADWALLVIGVLVGGVQLHELRRIRFPPLIVTLPLPEEDVRRQAAARVAQAAGAAGTLFLWLVSVLPGLRPWAWPDAALPAACLLWSLWLVPRRLAKRRTDDEE